MFFFTIFSKMEIGCTQKNVFTGCTKNWYIQSDQKQMVLLSKNLLHFSKIQCKFEENCSKLSVAEPYVSGQTVVSLTDSYSESQWVLQWFSLILWIPGIGPLQFEFLLSQLTWLSFFCAGLAQNLVFWRVFRAKSKYHIHFYGVQI